jgi:hypothetical protein
LQANDIKENPSVSHRLAQIPDFARVLLISPRFARL